MPRLVYVTTFALHRFGFPNGGNCRSVSPNFLLIHVSYFHRIVCSHIYYIVHLFVCQLGICRRLRWQDGPTTLFARSSLHGVLPAQKIAQDSPTTMFAPFVPHFAHGFPPEAGGLGL